MLVRFVQNTNYFHIFKDILCKTLMLNYLCTRSYSHVLSSFIQFTSTFGSPTTPNRIT